MPDPNDFIFDPTYKNMPCNTFYDHSKKSKTTKENNTSLPVFIPVFIVFAIFVFSFIGYLMGDIKKGVGSSSSDTTASLTAAQKHQRELDIETARVQKEYREMVEKGEIQPSVFSY